MESASRNNWHWLGLLSVIASVLGGIRPGSVPRLGDLWVIFWVLAVGCLFFCWLASGHKVLRVLFSLVGLAALLFWTLIGMLQLGFIKLHLN